MGTSDGDTIRVLHVDDEPEFAELTATYLERADDRFAVETAPGASQGLDRLTDDVDCVVSDYDMPGMDGLEFLAAVRDDYPDLPFILFTGKGSEAVASDAISAGVTDYLQKRPGSEQFELLAHRLRNAVDQYRATQQASNLDRIRGILSDVNQALVRADSREEIDRRVCEILSDAEPYRFAWIGRVDGDTGRVEARTSAGIHEGYLDDITVTFDGSATGQGPVGTALRERRVAVSQNVSEDPTFEPWREEATDRGYRAAAGVPFVYEGDIYGVLAVYADRTSAFDERERELLSELGDDIAHALHRVELRAELRQGEAHLEQTQVVGDVGSWHRDFETGDLYWSEEVYRIFGIPEDATPSYDLFIEAVHPEDRDYVEQRWAAAQSGDPYDIEHRIVVDGETRWVRERAQLEFDGEGNPTQGIGVVQDITERKEHQRELDETTQKLEALDRAFPDVALLVDVDGTYLDALAGKRTESLLYHGHQDAYAGSYTIRDTFPEDDADRALRAIRQAVESGEIQTLEYQLDVPSGDRWFEARIAPLATGPGGDETVVWVARDVTERRERERELERRTERLKTEVERRKAVETRYRALFDNMPGPIAYAEFEGGDPVVKAVNPAFEETFGVTASAAEGRSLDDVVVPAGGMDEAEAINDRVRDNEVFAVEVERMAADGLRTFNLLSVPLSSDADPPRGFAVYRDVTERKRRQRELRRQNERLDEFASIVSHDLRNPLHIAASRLELARDECESDHLDSAGDALERMEDLIEDLLALARAERPVTDTEAIALPALVENCWRTVETARATLNVETDRTIRADRRRLRQLVENLMRNAVEHGCGDVTVTVGDLDGGFYVADDGPGIPESERERVFESGYSTVEGGTGIGLDIVEQIVDAHGWAVSATESESGGARFEITDVDGEH